ncbi:hypothetical protein DPMN_160108 [Dreissena polymorpha]|uniref:Uncharacterized protein n=1 Tax=Dreissena polymorpha TaxID=45954 RepID=A0A9D4ING6_DREPO|nr:hypothetical protein DPMN_160108 [Dreissena polymorpha]
MPCESFRDSTHLQKIQAVRAGRHVVEESPGKNRGANPYHGVQMPKEDVRKNKTKTWLKINNKRCIHRRG